MNILEQWTDYSWFTLLIVAVIAYFLLQYGWGIIRQISASIASRKAYKQALQAGMKYIDKMDGFQFEYFLQHLLKDNGYRATVTSKTKDFGADLIIHGRDKIAVQAKRYGVKNTIGVRAIQEVFTAKAYYGCKEAWLLTNSRCTKSAVELAKACGVKLYQREELIQFINQANATVTAKDVYQTIDPEPRKCKKCSSMMVVRTKGDSKFFGCSSFPSCTHTEAIHGQH